MIEKKIYSRYAFSDDSTEKMKINEQIYSEMRTKYKITYGKADNLDIWDVVVELVSNRPGNTTYEVIKNEPKLSKHELALICDQGNLCFGFMSEGNKITIFTD